MEIINDIKKLIDLGVTKTAICKTLGIDRQLMDYRVERGLDFKGDEIFRFYDKYKNFIPERKRVVAN